MPDELINKNRIAIDKLHGSAVCNGEIGNFDTILVFLPWPEEKR